MAAAIDSVVTALSVAAIKIMGKPEMRANFEVNTAKGWEST
jgi:hypothetical protein